MSKTISGIAASDGIGIAKAYLLVDPDLSFEKQTISDVDAEIKRIHDSFNASTRNYKRLKKMRKQVLAMKKSPYSTPTSPCYPTQT